MTSAIKRYAVPLSLVEIENIIVALGIAADLANKKSNGANPDRNLVLMQRHIEEFDDYIRTRKHVERATRAIARK